MLTERGAPTAPPTILRGPDAPSPGSGVKAFVPAAATGRASLVFLVAARLRAARVLRAESSHGGERGRAAPSVRKQLGTAASASPWWLPGSASGDAIDGSRDRSSGQGVAGAGAGLLPRDTNGGRLPREAAASGRVRKRRVAAAQPRIGTSQRGTCRPKACGAPVPPRPRRVRCGGRAQKSGPAFAPRLLSHARIDRPASVICPPPWPVVARARVTPLMVDQPNSIPVPEGA